jgi:hypothetical protein
MRLRNPLLPAAIVAAGLVWLACSHKEYSEPGPPDGSTGDDGQSADSPLVTLDVAEDNFDCNPCLTVCDCTPGDTFFNPGTCETVTCNSGTWGGESCLGLGCAESGPDETGSESDGGLEASDGSMHPEDAAMDGSDGARDSASDGAIDGGD